MLDVFQRIVRPIANLLGVSILIATLLARLRTSLYQLPLIKPRLHSRIVTVPSTHLLIHGSFTVVMLITETRVTLLSVHVSSLCRFLPPLCSFGISIRWYIGNLDDPRRLNSAISPRTVHLAVLRIQPRRASSYAAVKTCLRPILPGILTLLGQYHSELEKRLL